LEINLTESTGGLVASPAVTDPLNQRSPRGQLTGEDNDTHYRILGDGPYSTQAPNRFTDERLAEAGSHTAASAGSHVRSVRQGMDPVRIYKAKSEEKSLFFDRFASRRLSFSRQLSSQIVQKITPDGDDGIVVFTTTGAAG